MTHSLPYLIELLNSGLGSHQSVKTFPLAGPAVLVTDLSGVVPTELIKLQWPVVWRTRLQISSHAFVGKNALHY